MKVHKDSSPRVQTSIRSVMVFTTLVACGMAGLVNGFQLRSITIIQVSLCFLLMLFSVLCFTVSEQMMLASKRATAHFVGLCLASVGGVLAVTALVGIVLFFASLTATF